MNKSLERKLLHFYTDGSIYEDFAEARTEKTVKLRRVIRVCFYAHCAAALIAVALAVVFRAGAVGIAAVAVCETLLAGMAFMAVGDMTLMKTLLYCGDIVFAAAMFVTGAFGGNKTPFFAIGALSAVMALPALAAFFAAYCKAFLENFSPLSLRREHYTLLPNFGSELPYDDIPDMPEDMPAIVPPKRSEFMDLADKLREILCSPKKEEKVISETVKNAENDTPETEVLQ